MRFPGLCGGSSTTRSPIADCEQLWNWYVEKTDTENPKATPVLYPTPGFVGAFAFLPTPVRGLWAQDNRGFAVSGDSLFELHPPGPGAQLRPPTLVPSPDQPIIKHSDPVPPLPQMNLPIIYVNGAPGTTTYGYK